MTTSTNPLYRIFLNSDQGPELLEGTDFNSQDDIHRAHTESENGELIIPQHLLARANAVLAQDFPADTVLGLDVDSDMALVDLGVHPDTNADVVWEQPEHEVSYSFDVAQAKRIFGAT